MSSSKCDSSQSSSGLNESWVELNMSAVNSNKSSGQSTPSLEKLLVDAQKESENSSGSDSSNSSNSPPPRSPHSCSPPLSPHSSSSDDLGPPAGDTVIQGEFINDWSSRPEIVPPSDYGVKLERPIKRHPLSVRNTRVMRDGWFNSENLPLVVTHAASFAVGASLVCWYLTKD